MTTKNSDASCKTIIDGVAYDVSSFVSKHPGGVDLIRLAEDRDASVLFHSYHSNTDVALARLKSLPKISEKDIPKPSYNMNIEKSEHYLELKKRVNQYFKANQLKKRGGSFMIFKSLLLVAVTFFVYYLTLVQSMWLLTPLLGFFLAVNGLAIQHDANHGAFSNFKLLNDFAAFMDDVVGGSALVWRHQHDVSHHVYPNHHSEDVDTFSHNPFIRFNPKFPVHGWHKFQFLYVPLSYSLVGISYLIGDFQIFFSGHYENVPLQPLSLKDRVLFFLGKFVHLSLFMFIPYSILGWSFLWTFYLPMQFFGGLFLGSSFAVSHNTEECEYNLEETDWAELQIRTSCNWSPKSLFWLYSVGGLNFQIEHHLFPGICHIHYPAIGEIVKQYCAEQNWPYNSYPTFANIYKSHIQALYHLGREKRE